MGYMDKIAGDMPPFTSQDRPDKVKEIYRALKRDHPEMPAEMKARIAARQGKRGKQHVGPPYKAPITSTYREKVAASPFFTPKEGGVAEVIRPLNDGPFVAEVWRTTPRGSQIHPGQIRKIMPTTVNQEKSAMTTRKEAASSFVKQAMPMGTGGAGQYMAKGGVVKGKKDEKKDDKKDDKKGGFVERMKAKAKSKGKEKDEKKDDKKTEETGKTKDMGKRLAGRKGYAARMKKKDE